MRGQPPDTQTAKIAQAPNWTVFVSCAPAEIRRSIAIRAEIERTGATAIVDEKFILSGADDESLVLDALMVADEIVFILGGDNARFLDRRYAWIALGAGKARGVPLYLLPYGAARNRKKQIAELPTVFKEMPRPQNLKAYVQGLQERLENRGIKDPVSVFFSYSHKDQSHLDDLQEMLYPLVDTRCFSVWWDGKIKPGEVWRKEIDENLAKASVGVLLVSRPFLRSEFINNNELDYLLDSADRKKVTLLWVLVGDCLYKHTRIVKYQAAHTNPGKPLSTYRKAARERVLVEICESIAAACALH